MTDIEIRPGNDGDVAIAMVRSKIRVLRYDGRLTHPWVMDRTYVEGDYIQSNWTGYEEELRGFRIVDPAECKIEEPLGLGAVVTAGCPCDAVPHKFLHDPYSTIFDSHLNRGIGTDKKVWKAVCGHHSWDMLIDPALVVEGYTGE